jgi:hypothetical protein
MRGCFRATAEPMYRFNLPSNYQTISPDVLIIRATRVCCFTWLVSRSYFVSPNHHSPAWCHQPTS